MTNDQQNLLNRIHQINEETQKWLAEDPKNRFATLLGDDLEALARQGITTVNEFEHYHLVAEAFEGTRSAFGYKPSWSGLMAMTNEDLRKEIVLLTKECKRQIEDERAEELAHENAVKAATTVHSGFSIGELIGA